MSTAGNSEEKKPENIILKVKEAYPKDVGRGKVRISSEIFKKLNASAGDIVVIEKKRKAVAVIWHSLPGTENDSIMMDGEIRRNSGCSLNDYVSIRTVKTQPGKKIFLAPLDAKINVDSDFERFVHARLIDRALVAGNIVSVNLFGSPISFIVKKIIPNAIVYVNPHTEITVTGEPIGDLMENVGVRYEDIGGLKEEIKKTREMIELPLRRPELFRHLGIDPPQGVLLYGPPGCGKTLLARAVANESEANFYAINGPEITSKYYGESEAKLRGIFKKADESSPSIIFIDELDAIAPRREEVTGEAEKRVVAQLLTLMDGLKNRGKIIVIGATNRIDAIDPALRRPGRFDREITISMPDVKGRKEIFHIHSRGMPLSKDVDVQKLSEITYGYTGADIQALCKESAMKALRGYLPNVNIEEEVSEKILNNLTVTNTDFFKAYKEIIPTHMREVQIVVPNVKWNDIGGLIETKEELREVVEWPLKYPDKFKKIGITPKKGVLLYGVAGTGKTMLAEAIASESQVNFIPVKGPEILSKWVGESEKGIRKIFARARTASPSIVYFDEIEALIPKRTGSDATGVTDRVISQMLTEIDGINRLHDVIIIASTNRPDLVDEALLRPGRIDLKMYVPHPSELERLAILEIQTKFMTFTDDVSLDEIVSLTEYYTGADLSALVREAGLNSLRRDIDSEQITWDDFIKAFDKIKPSLNKQIIKWYDTYSKKAHEVQYDVTPAIA